MASQDLRLMAVHAHPDDESSKGAATMARYAAEGVQVLVVTCTGGERGSILNPRLENDETILADLPAGSFVADVPWIPLPGMRRTSIRMAHAAAELIAEHSHRLPTIGTCTLQLVVLEDDEVMEAEIQALDLKRGWSDATRDYLEEHIADR